MKYFWAVGFKEKENRSIFYIKKASFLYFMEKLGEYLMHKDVDFVILRVVK